LTPTVAIGARGELDETQGASQWQDHEERSPGFGDFEHHLKKRYQYGVQPPEADEEDEDEASGVEGEIESRGLQQPTRSVRSARANAGDSGYGPLAQEGGGADASLLRELRLAAEAAETSAGQYSGVLLSLRSRRA